MLCKGILSSDLILSAFLFVVIFVCLFWGALSFVLETGLKLPHVAEDNLPYRILLPLLRSAGIAGVYHHACFLQDRRLETGPALHQLSDSQPVYNSLT